MSGVLVATCMQPTIPVFTAMIAVTMGLEPGSYQKFLGILLAVGGSICMVSSIEACSEHAIPAELTFCPLCIALSVALWLWGSHLACKSSALIRPRPSGRFPYIASQPCIAIMSCALCSMQSQLTVVGSSSNRSGELFGHSRAQDHSATQLITRGCLRTYLGALPAGGWRLQRPSLPGRVSASDDGQCVPAAEHPGDGCVLPLSQAAGAALLCHVHCGMGIHHCSGVHGCHSSPLCASSPMERSPRAVWASSILGGCVLGPGILHRHLGNAAPSRFAGG